MWSAMLIKCPDYRGCNLLPPYLVYLPSLERREGGIKGTEMTLPLTPPTYPDAWMRSGYQAIAGTTAESSPPADVCSERKRKCRQNYDSFQIVSRVGLVL